MLFAFLRQARHFFNYYSLRQVTMYKNQLQGATAFLYYSVGCNLEYLPIFGTFE